jgi:hypothetical protein
MCQIYIITIITIMSSCNISFNGYKNYSYLWSHSKFLKKRERESRTQRSLIPLLFLTKLKVSELKVHLGGVGSEGQEPSDPQSLLQTLGGEPAPSQTRAGSGRMRFLHHKQQVVGATLVMDNDQVPPTWKFQCRLGGDQQARGPSGK